MIADQSQGIPRKINRLCFSALSLGCAMGRKEVNVAMMEEVIADHDVESLHRPNVTPRVVSSPVTTRSALSSYPSKPKRSFGRWALGTASVAASFAIGIGILSFSHGSIDRFTQESSVARTAIRGAAASILSSKEVKSDQVSSVLNVQDAEISNSAPVQSSPSSDDAEINTVIVQPGETLRQIILRSMGEYNGGTIKQFRKLNPTIANLDHLEAGQAIRLPRFSVSVDSTAGSEGTGTGGKN